MRTSFILALLLVVFNGQFGLGDCMTPYMSKSTVTASSQLSPKYSAAHALLSSQTAWCPKQNFTDKEYLQVDFGERKVVKRIQIAGEANPPVNQTARRVTKYLIQVSADGATYEDFEAISKADATMQIRTRYIRIVPLEFIKFPCMRLEISGCKAKNPELCSENNGGCSQECIQHSKYCVFGKCFFKCHIDFLCTRWVECVCNPGYKLLADKKNCADINECDTNNGNCDQICENSKGSYQCKCRSGFILDSNKHKCNDINECDTNKGGCNQLCRNTFGSYYCLCRVGFELSQDNHTCNDIDECAVNNGGCSYGCQNLEGRYICTCPHGFELDQTGKNCKDSNECLLANGGCETNCHNTNGSYTCSCNPGFELYEKFKCRDIDECSRNIDKCDETSTNCRNYQGGYECPCKSGYKHKQGDSFSCEIITCPPLIEVMGTTVSPKPQCLAVDGRKVNDTCKFSCQNGYKLPDPQKDTLKCLETGSWDAPIINCERVNCPALRPVQNGNLLPQICPISGNFFGSTCHYSCNSGYKLVGKAVRTCQANGQWDDQTVATCDKDYPKPWISCPTDVNVVLAPNTNDYDITGLLEQPKSNVKNIQIYPEKYRSNTVFPSGVTVLTYVASNEIGETANCTTDIIVQDKQKPTIVFCPGTVYQAITASEARITWKEPEFTDNVKVDRVTSTKKSGDTFPLGSTIVKYEAFDEKGNVESCSFTVELTRKKCVTPNNPDNGKLSCNGIGDFMYCSVICNTGKQLFKYSIGSSCNPSSLVWTPAEIPDCVDGVNLPASGQCPTQTIPQQSLIKNFENPIKLCVKCPRGMKYDTSLKDCVACPVGYISQQESSSNCTKCPVQTSTRKEGSKTCIDLCDKGQSSIDGFDSPDKQACVLCNVGFYQDQYGATQCKQCPNGRTTVAKGSTTMEDCGTTPTVSSFGPPSMVVNVDENGRTEFVCMAAGPPVPTFLVKKQKPAPDGFGGPIRVEYIRSGNVVTGVRYIILSATEHDAGLYACTATNKFGSDTKHLTLNVVLGGGSASGAGQ